MHTTQFLRSAISILAVLSQLPLAKASPLDFDLASAEAGLEKRGCSNPCGYYAQLCCSSSQTCTTSHNGQAVCSDSGSGGSGSGSGGGSWEYYTTTYVVTETDLTTKTSTWSSYRAAQTTGGGSGGGGSSGNCRSDLGESMCGNTCCGAAYICQNDQCVMGSSSIWATATPPVRGTSASTLTQTASATTTQGFETPVSTNGSPMVGVKAPDEHNGLSGGAIAGIVIGSIAGAFLLLLVCACLCCRGLIDGLMACLGIGRRRRREETTYVEGRHSRHSHSRPDGRTWFGQRPARSSVSSEKDSKWKGWATVGIILGAIALCLGLKRRRDHDDEKSSVSYPSSYYYYSDYYTNPSSVSSDRRTRRTRDSRRTRRSRTDSRR